MSLVATSAVWRANIRPTSRKLVALVLADHADESGGSIYPSMERVAQMAGVTVRQARRRVTELLDMKAVEVVGLRRGGERIAVGRERAGGAPGTTVEYRLCLDRLAAMATTPDRDVLPTTEADALRTEEAGDLPLPETEDSDDRQGGHPGSGGRSPASDEPPGTALEPAAEALARDGAANPLLPSDWRIAAEEARAAAGLPALAEFELAAAWHKFCEFTMNRGPFARESRARWIAWAIREKQSKTRHDGQHGGSPEHRTVPSREAEATSRMLRERSMPLNAEEQRAADAARNEAMRRLNRPVTAIKGSSS